ncbi:early activation antigen CD69 isoform X2 [Cheilinus undulatus]|uniref:early activation antigen CD69 isoform X2 n=1 Tax=Cheilinus undulatus TaxID=241271 RepID=UPI001BD45ACE|nr:early activation antigen CD69 isoform X2 [Cheilinus undulatus]
MYIKFCRSYGEDKKDEAKENLSSESALSVELQGEKGKQTDGNVRLYRIACALLTLICLVLLLIIIILCMKPKAGSTDCPKRVETTAPSGSSVSTCTYEHCQALFPNVQLQYLGCRQCADGWLTFGRSCFFVSTYRLNWEDSQRNCSSRGGNLAIISSPEIQNYLTQTGNGLYWMGLRQRGRTWSWVNNSALKKSYWADATSSGDCGILDSEKPLEKNWIKASCRATTYFICQLMS